MPNSRQTSLIASPSNSRATNLSRSSITEHCPARRHRLPHPKRRMTVYCGASFSPVCWARGADIALRGDAAGFGEVIEPFPVMAEPLGLGAKLLDEIVQLGRRHKRLDIVPAGPAGPLGVTQNLAAA